MKLEGKVAIVTGGGQGIGQGIVHRLAEEGADVAVVDINRDTARKVADEVKALGRKSLAIEADVTDSKQVDRLVQETIDTFGKIDILVNNAGKTSSLITPVRTKSRFIDQEEKEWDQGIAVNFKTQVLMSQAVAPYLIKQRSGKIINIGAETGNNRMGGKVTPYMEMKAANIHFTKSLAAELAGDNINVNCVDPGWVWGPSYERRGESREHFEQRVAPQIPLKRSQTPEDIGDAVVFLVSEDARNITGQLLNINGGLYMP